MIKPLRRRHLRKTQQAQCQRSGGRDQIISKRDFHISTVEEIR
jgi:hypothetical protein